jgi:ribosomal protein S14
MVSLPMKQRRQGPALSKAELRAQAEQAVAATNKPIQKLPTKVVRQCGRCGEPSAVMVEPGQPVPAFKCKRCDRQA